MKSKVKNVVLVVIILLTAWQGVQFIRFAADEIPTVWTWIGRPMQWRSAAYTTSENFADYIAFAHEVIPEDASVAIPSNDLAPWNFSFKAYLQFLLFPRDIFWCSDFTCLVNSPEEGAYTLIEDTSSTIQNTELTENDNLLEFNERWSILAPGTHTMSSGRALSNFSSIKQIGRSMVLPLLWLAAAALPGLLLTSILLPNWGWLSRLWMGLTLSLGGISILMFLGLLVTEYSSSALILTATSAWYFLSWGICFWLSKPVGINFNALRQNLKIDPLEISLLLVGLVVAFISIGKGYWATDGIVLWGAKGYGISLFGLSEGASAVGTLSAKYPLQLPILISIFKTLFGDLVPESKILPVIFFIGIPLVVKEYFRPKYKKQHYTWLLLLWVISPQIILQGSIGYANLSATFYLVSAVLVALLGYEDTANLVQKKRLLTLSGVLFALSGWNRPEAAIMSAVVLVLLAIWKRDIKTSWMMYLPLLFYSLVWGLTQNIVYTRQPFTDGYLGDGLLNVLQGNIKFGDLLYLIEGFFSKLLDPALWGLVGWVILLMLVSFILLRKSNPDTQFLFLSGVLLTLAGAAVIYLRTYNPSGCDVSCMVRTAMERMILPGIAVLWVGAGDYLFGLVKED